MWNLFRVNNNNFILALLHSLYLKNEKKKHLFPIPNCYYVHYAVIMKKKFSQATTFTTPWSWQKYIISFQHCVCYALIMTKKLYFYFHTAFTTSWLRKNIFYFTFQHYVHNALITTENTFIFIPTLGSLHDKFSISVRFVDLIVISPSGNSVSVSIRFVDMTIILPSGISVESHNISD